MKISRRLEILGMALKKTVSKHLKCEKPTLYMYKSVSKIFLGLIFILFSTF